MQGSYKQKVLDNCTGPKPMKLVLGEGVFPPIPNTWLILGLQEWWFGLPRNWAQSIRMHGRCIWLNYNLRSDPAGSKMLLAAVLDCMHTCKWHHFSPHFSNAVNRQENACGYFPRSLNWPGIPKRCQWNSTDLKIRTHRYQHRTSLRASNLTSLNIWVPHLWIAETRLTTGLQVPSGSNILFLCNSSRRKKIKVCKARVK